MSMYVIDMVASAEFILKSLLKIVIAAVEGAMLMNELF